MVYYLKLYAVVFSLLLYSIPLTAQIKKTVTAKNKLESKIMISSDTSYLRGERVHLLDSSFLLPGIDQALRIWVYLPKNYKSSKKNYPVIYFPEGSNVFNKKNETNQWQVNIILDSIEAVGSRTAIVVAIDAGFENAGFYKSHKVENDTLHLWNDFSIFLADRLKPFIDQNFRTLGDPNNTLIAGAAQSANHSYFTFLKRNETFGKAGLFSPVFEISDHLNYFTDSLAKGISGKLFYYSGEMEDVISQRKGEEIMMSLGEKSAAVIYSLSDTEGISNPVFWRKYFSAFVTWALADGNNSIISIKN